MKKLLTALVLCGVVGLTAGMLAHPAFSADDNPGGAADSGAAAGTSPADEGVPPAAQPGDEPAQGDEPPPADDAGADPEGEKK